MQHFGHANQATLQNLTRRDDNDTWKVSHKRAA